MPDRTFGTSLQCENNACHEQRLKRSTVKAPYGSGKLITVFVSGASVACRIVTTARRLEPDRVRQPYRVPEKVDRRYRRLDKRESPAETLQVDFLVIQRPVTDIRRFPDRTFWIPDVTVKVDSTQAINIRAVSISVEVCQI